jgi:hypothetical protein
MISSIVLPHKQILITIVSLKDLGKVEECHVFAVL